MAQENNKTMVIGNSYIYRVKYDYQTEFTKNVIDCAEHDDVIKVRCSNMLAPLKVAFQREMVALESSFKSPLTVQVQDQNALRNSTYVALKELTNASLHSVDQNVKDKAAEVKYILDLKSVRYDDTLEAKTGGFFTLIGALRTQCEEALEVCGLTTCVNQLADANQAVYDLMFERGHETMLYNKGAAQEARKEVERLLDLIFEQVNVWAATEGPAEFEQFILYINTEIERIKRYALGITGGTPGASAPGDIVPPTEGTTPNPDDSDQQKPNPDDQPDENPDNGNPDSGSTGGTLKPDPDAPGEGNGENEDEYTPPDNDGGFGKAVRRIDV